MKICWPMAKSRAPVGQAQKVSWALELDENGQLMALHPLQQEEKRGKKQCLLHVSCKFRNRLNALVVWQPIFCVITVLTCSVLTEKANRSVQCSAAAAKELHLAILQNVPGQAAQAVRNFL